MRLSPASWQVIFTLPPPLPGSWELSTIFRGKTMSALVIVEDKKTELERRSETILQVCEEYQVIDDKSLAYADDKVIECKNLMRAIKEVYDPIVKSAHTAHKVATGARNKAIDPVDRGSKILAKKMISYQQEQRRKAQEEQDRLDEIARKEHEESIQKQAEELEAAGETEAAEAVLDMVDDAPVSEQVAFVEPRTKLAMKTDWEIVGWDLSKVTQEYLKVDAVKALKVCRASKGTIPIPGFTFREIQTPIRRGE